ncbi:hypothetical protein Tco_0512046 [Tanacetum coccineum]
MDGIVTDAVDWALQASLRDRFRDLPEADKKEILHHRMWETNSYNAHEDHKQLYEAMEKSMTRDHFEQLLTDLDDARKRKKRRQDSPKTPHGSPPHQPPPPPPQAGLSGTSRTSGASGSSQVPPPPPPPSTNQSDQSISTVAPSSSKTTTLAEYTAWMTTDSRLKPFVSPILEELHMDDDTTLDEQSIPSSDLPVSSNNWASALASTYAPPPENSLLVQTGDMAIYMDWFCKKQRIIELKQQDLEGPAYEIVKVFHPNVIHIQFQMEDCHKLLTDQVDELILRHNVSKPLPLGGPPGQVTIQSDFFFNKDLGNLRYGRKSGRPALSISKMKAAYYPDVGLEQMVPDQIWIEEECKYDIAAMYGISHWWFQRQRFYIDRHTSEGDHRAIVLHRADLKEYTIAEKDFKYLYLSDFETRNLVIRQRVEDFQLGIESYQTQDKYGVQMIMRFNEIHKFSDGTLQQIDEALDYRVKEFKVNRMSLGLNTRFWTRKDVDRSKEFMSAIQKWLKIRRIFQNLKSFVGGRLREGDYRLLKRTE